MEEKIEYPKLPEDFKLKWTEALRSGDYKQATESLIRITDDEDEETYGNIEGYCCLGVACRVAGLDNEYLTVHDTIPTNVPAFDVIPDAIRGESVLQENRGNPVVKILTCMNDGCSGQTQKSFSEIADWIDQNL